MFLNFELILCFFLLLFDILLFVCIFCDSLWYMFSDILLHVVSHFVICCVTKCQMTTYILSDIVWHFVRIVRQNVRQNLPRMWQNVRRMWQNVGQNVTRMWQNVRRMWQNVGQNVRHFWQNVRCFWQNVTYFWQNVTWIHVTFFSRSDIKSNFSQTCHHAFFNFFYQKLFILDKENFFKKKSKKTEWDVWLFEKISCDKKRVKNFDKFFDISKSTWAKKKIFFFFRFIIETFSPIFFFSSIFFEILIKMSYFCHMIFWNFSNSTLRNHVTKSKKSCDKSRFW